VSEAAFTHPYIPNSAPGVREEMLREVGLDSVEDILVEIPGELRVQGLLDLPEPLISEYDLRRHVQGLLDRNVSSADCLSFLGGGCWPHFVPALCDEIVSRGEFLTAYSGSSYSDLGKHQARFEYNSLMAELLDYDVVVEPAYDWGSAAGFAARMASRLTGRRELLVPQNLGRERRSIIAELCEPEYMAGHIAVRGLQNLLGGGKAGAGFAQTKAHGVARMGEFLSGTGLGGERPRHQCLGLARCKSGRGA